MNLLRELVGALVLLAATGIAHAAATALAFRLGQHRASGPSRRARDAVRLRRIVLVVAVFFAAHVAEAAGWGAWYLARGFFPDFEHALHYSLGAYTTAGAPGLGLPAGWRLFGSLEAVAGMLMFGWSTGILATIVLHLVEEEAAPRHRA